MVPSSSVAFSRLINGHAVWPARLTCGEELGLDLGGIVHAGGDAVGDQVDQRAFLALGRAFQQFDQFGHLLFGQGQGRDAEGGAFGDVLAIGFEHGGVLSLESCLTAFGASGCLWPRN